MWEIKCEGGSIRCVRCPPGTRRISRRSCAPSP